MQTPRHFLKKQQMQVCIDLGFQVDLYLSALKTIEYREPTRKQTKNTHNWTQTVILNIDLTEEAMSIFWIHPWLKSQSAAKRGRGSET